MRLLLLYFYNSYVDKEHVRFTPRIMKTIKLQLQFFTLMISWFHSNTVTFIAIYKTVEQIKPLVSAGNIILILLVFNNSFWFLNQVDCLVYIMTYAYAYKLHRCFNALCLNVQECIKKKKVAEPDRYLSDRFWNTNHHTGVVGG